MNIKIPNTHKGAQVMDTVKKELQGRKEEIKKELRLLFQTKNRITSQDVPEIKEKEAATMLLDIMQEALDEITEEILFKN